MSEIDKDKIIKNSKKAYEEYFYQASKLSKLIEELDINEEQVKKEDIVIIDEPLKIDEAEFGTIYQFDGKLYKKVSGEYDDKILCYTDIMMELIEVNNKIYKLSKDLEEFEEAVAEGEDEAVDEKEE